VNASWTTFRISSIRLVADDPPQQHGSRHTPSSASNYRCRLFVPRPLALAVMPNRPISVRSPARRSRIIASVRRRRSVLVRPLGRTITVGRGGDARSNCPALSNPPYVYRATCVSIALGIFPGRFPSRESIGDNPNKNDGVSMQPSGKIRVDLGQNPTSTPPAINYAVDVRGLTSQDENRAFRRDPMRTIDLEHVWFGWNQFDHVKHALSSCFRV